MFFSGGRKSANPTDTGNQVAAMVAPLGTHLADPLERLAYVHSQTVNSKAMTDAIGARNMTEMSKVSPALFMALGAQLYTRLGLADRLGPAVNTVVTNVPGPPVPIYSAGAKLQSMMGLLCLTDGVGLGHTVQSYVDEATIAFTACRSVMPDPELYAQYIGESFAELRAAAKDAASDAGPRERPATPPVPSATIKPRKPVRPATQKTKPRKVAKS